MAKHSKYNILHSKKFFILVSYWFVSTFLVSCWLALTFFIKNMDTRKYLTFHFTVYILKVPKLFTLCVHDVVGKSFLYNLFRATRYKTTSLPAALNQARRIDTLDMLYLYIACKLVLYIMETIVIHYYVTRSSLKYSLNMWWANLLSTTSAS